MNSIEKNIYDILLDKQKYLKEQKGKDKLYFGTEYVKRICGYNGYSIDKVTQAVRNLRKAGLIVGKTGKEGVYGYMTIVPPQRDEKQQVDWDAYRQQYEKEHENDPLPFEPVYDTNNKPDNMSDNDTKIDNYGTYTYESGYTQFIITVAA